jgi:hypothetical protein
MDARSAGQHGWILDEDGRKRNAVFVPAPPLAVDGRPRRTWFGSLPWLSVSAPENAMPARKTPLPHFRQWHSACYYRIQ